MPKNVRKQQKTRDATSTSSGGVNNILPAFEFAGISTSKGRTGQEGGLIKNCHVLLKRLSASEIFFLSGGQTIKQENSDEVPTPKRPKQPLKPVVKQPEINKNLHVPKKVKTPLKSSTKSVKKQLPLVAPDGNEQEKEQLIKRYGKRYFQCMVKVKRLNLSQTGTRPAQVPSQLPKRQRERRRRK